MLDNSPNEKWFTICALIISALMTILVGVALLDEQAAEEDVDHVPLAWAEEFGAYATRLARKTQAERARIGSLYLSRPELLVPALVAVGGAAVGMVVTDDAPTVQTRTEATVGAASEAALLAIAYEDPNFWINMGNMSRNLLLGMPGLPDDWPGAPDEGDAGDGADSVQ